MTESEYRNLIASMPRETMEVIGRLKKPFELSNAIVYLHCLCSLMEGWRNKIDHNINTSVKIKTIKSPVKDHGNYTVVQVRNQNCQRHAVMINCIIENSDRINLSSITPKNEKRITSLIIEHIEFIKKVFTKARWSIDQINRHASLIKEKNLKKNDHE